MKVLGMIIQLIMSVVVIAVGVFLLVVAIALM